MLDTLLRHLDMVRLSVGLAAIVTIMGCTGLIQGGAENNLTPQQQLARQDWLTKALPVFKNQCNACHSGSMAAIGFIGGSSDLGIRDTLLGFDPQVVNLDAPQSSRVLTKGAHAGPSLSAQDSSNILEWINAEKDAAGTGTGSGGPILETALFTPLLCSCPDPNAVPADAQCQPGGMYCPINRVDLTPLGLPGARIDFVAQPLSTDTYVTDLYLIASTDGVYIEHPLFVSWPPDPKLPGIPDQIDRFFAVKMNEAPATAAPSCPPSGPSCGSIAGGTAAFVGFTPTNQLSIHFKVVDKYHLDSTMPPPVTGCKVLSTFKTDALPVLNTGTQACASCHSGQNANATSAMDLTGIGSGTDSMVQLACNQVLSRANFQDIPNSSVLLAPNGASGLTHPLKLSTASTPTLGNFQTGLTTWMNAEKVAP